MGPSIAHTIPTLMDRLLTHFEPSELVDFMNFIVLLIHKLQVRPDLSNSYIIVLTCLLSKTCLTCSTTSLARSTPTSAR